MKLLISNILILLLFPVTLISAGDQPQADRPNVLFIMADDHTTQAIGAYGSRLAKLNPTPNIDSLAKGGMRFDRVFCNNSICTPNETDRNYPKIQAIIDAHRETDR